MNDKTKEEIPKKIEGSVLSVNLSGKSVDGLLAKCLTTSEFAALLGISKQRISKLYKEGGLVRRPDKRFDLQNPVNNDYICKVSDRKKINGQQNSIDLFVPGQKAEAMHDRSDVPGSISAAEANRLKIIEQYFSLQIKNHKDRNKLIDKTLVSRVFEELYLIDTNSWRSLAANLAPIIAAIASVDDSAKLIRIEEAIDKEVFAILQQVKGVINKFLESEKESFANIGSSAQPIN